MAKHDKYILSFFYNRLLFLLLRTWLKPYIWHCIMMTIQYQQLIAGAIFCTF